MNRFFLDCLYIIPKLTFSFTSVVVIVFFQKLRRAAFMDSNRRRRVHDMLTAFSGWWLHGDWEGKLVQLDLRQRSLVGCHG